MFELCRNGLTEHCYWRLGLGCSLWMIPFAPRQSVDEGLNSSKHCSPAQVALLCIQVTHHLAPTNCTTHPLSNTSTSSSPLSRNRQQRSIIPAPIPIPIPIIIRPPPHLRSKSTNRTIYKPDTLVDPTLAPLNQTPPRRRRTRSRGCVFPTGKRRSTSFQRLHIRDLKLKRVAAMLVGVAQGRRCWS